jgi:hypothetical protein
VLSSLLQQILKRRRYTVARIISTLHADWNPADEVAGEVAGEVSALAELIETNRIGAVDGAAVLRTVLALSYRRSNDSASPERFTHALMEQRRKRSIHLVASGETDHLDSSHKRIGFF